MDSRFPGWIRRPRPVRSFILPSLREELVKHLGEIQLDLRFLGAMSTDERRNQVLAEMEQMDKQWTKAALYLLENHPQDVMMFVFMSIDTVQHYFWQHMDKDHFIHDPKLAPKFGDAVRKVYERLDAAAGQIIDRLPPETTVFVVSDHGGGPVVDRTIFLNRYLAQLGLLHYHEKATSGIRRLGKKILRLGFSLLRSTLSSRQKSRLALLFPKIRAEERNGLFILYEHRLEPDQGLLQRGARFASEHLDQPQRGKAARHRGSGTNTMLLSTLSSTKLAELKDPRTGKPVINRVYRRNEIFHGPFAHEGADLVLDWWSEDSLFSTQPSFPEDTDKPALIIREHRPSETSEWGGTHRLHGIVIARGPAFKSGAEIANARLIDIAPTLLHLLEVPVPEDMDGKVLTGLFQPDFLAAHAVRAGAASGTSGADRPSGYTDEESAKVEERLQALGYLEIAQEIIHHV